MNSIMKTCLAIGLFVSTGALAQPTSIPRDFGALSWEIAFPSDNNYLSKTSFSGWRLEYRRMLKPTLSVGLAASWNAFDSYFGTKTYKSADGASAVTTDMVRQVYTVPITLITHYYPATNNKMLKPYGGVGLGTQYTEHNTYYNIYQATENNWGFVVRPEIGTLVRFGTSPASALLSIGYNIATNKNKVFDVNGINQFTINIGIGFGR